MYSFADLPEREEARLCKTEGDIFIMVTFLFVSSQSIILKSVYVSTSVTV